MSNYLSIYLSRIRGFNGFGPGEYTYCRFTTLALAPAVPKIIRLAADSVTLQWTFTEGGY
jgi:hypothetical protein